MSQENPFTPTFGEVPACLAGRDEVVARLAHAFDREGRSPDLTTLITGARGTGKTALLAVAAEEAAARGWVVVRVPALPGMLDEILDKALVASRHLTRGEDAHLTGIGIGSLLSASWEQPLERTHAWATSMDLLTEELTEARIGLLILVDEVRADLDEMVRLVATYQQLVGERRRVGLIMAGIPYQVSALVGNQSASFLRRAQQLTLGRIGDAEVSEAIRKTVAVGRRTIESEALARATEGTGGFAFMLQLVGYRMWEVDPESPRITVEHARVGIEVAQQEMKERVLEATWRDLSDGDIAFLRAMLPDRAESRVRDISERMGKPGSYVSTYRRRLLLQGVIGERRRGTVGFELPAFREFLEEKLEEL